MTELLTNYLACWNETDPDRRRELISAFWAPEATYTDPMVETTGHSGLDATIEAVQRQFPGWVFTPMGPFDAHHRQARFSWGLGPAGEEPPIVGFDVVRLDGDGRIATVLGFLDKVPAGA